MLQETPPAMDFGPNLFGNGETTNLAESTSTNSLEGGALVAESNGQVGDEGSAGAQQGATIVVSTLPAKEAGEGDIDFPSQQEGQSTDQDVSRSKAGSEALSSAKNAAKLFECITGFDDMSAKQRTVVRDLLTKQSAALELKLQGGKAPEGEDFDSIAKQLRRENNRLDTLLEGKEALFGKARKAAEDAIVKMKLVINDIKQLEEEG
ncbi:hypothetical protein [Pseudomonas sp. 2FE]|uniref:hypothetical protein n=1 Tax=Pseudomonas sp. 2FE TaxID=2502190 RepID=UPI0010F76C75|nr:hypothetical protein [Pseudomonas sp. 2FE]